MAKHPHLPKFIPLWQNIKKITCFLRREAVKSIQLISKPWEALIMISCVFFSPIQPASFFSWALSFIQTETWDWALNVDIHSQRNIPSVKWDSKGTINPAFNRIVYWFEGKSKRKESLRLLLFVLYQTVTKPNNRKHIHFKWTIFFSFPRHAHYIIQLKFECGEKVCSFKHATV